MIKAFDESPHDQALVRSAERQIERQEERAQIARSLRAIAGWLADPLNALEKESETLLNTILSSYQKKTQVTLIAVTNYRLKKMLEYLQLNDKIDDKIEATLDEFPIHSLEDLRLLSDSFHRRTEDITKFIERMSDKAPVMPTAVSEEHKAGAITHGEEPVFDSPKKRELLLNLIRQISSYADEAVKETTVDPKDLFDKVMSEEEN